MSTGWASYTECHVHATLSTSATSASCSNINFSNISNISFRQQHQLHVPGELRTLQQPPTHRRTLTQNGVTIVFTLLATDTVHPRYQFPCNTALSFGTINPKEPHIQVLRHTDAQAYTPRNTEIQIGKPSTLDRPTGKHSNWLLVTHLRVLNLKGTA